LKIFYICTSISGRRKTDGQTECSLQWRLLEGAIVNRQQQRRRRQWCVKIN